MGGLSTEGEANDGGGIGKPPVKVAKQYVVTKEGEAVLSHVRSLLKESGCTEKEMYILTKPHSISLLYSIRDKKSLPDCFEEYNRLMEKTKGSIELMELDPGIKQAYDSAFGNGAVFYGSLVEMQQHGFLGNDLKITPKGKRALNAMEKYKDLINESIK